MSTKERVSPTETAPSMTREQALAALVEAEAQLNSDTAADALLVMIAVYFVLEASDGAEAPGVKELRSWLVGALETLGLPDEAAAMRQRGSFVEHPLSIMPSTWFKTTGAIATNSMSVDEALAAVERGLGLLQAGDVDGLALLVDAYFALEQQQGAESVDATTLRCFLVGLLEAGGFVDEGQSLRVRGSMVEPTAEDLQVYAATWLRILEAEQSAPVIDSGIDKQSLEGTTSDPPPSDPGGGEEPVDPSRRWSRRAARSRASASTSASAPSDPRSGPRACSGRWGSTLTGPCSGRSSSACRSAAAGSSAATETSAG